jgi:CO/xanthine dehydrogenase FAD-binding subunit
VKPGKFAYLRATSVEEVLWAIQEYGYDATILAGGQSLVPMLNMRLARPGVLVDVNGLRELDGIESNGSLSIGALTRQAKVEHSPEVAAAAPLLAEAVPYIGHRAIRNRGTVGGNVAHADGASELPAVLVALGAEIVAVGQGGERVIPAEDFFVTHYTTALDGEMLTHVRIPKHATPPRSAFIEIARRHGDFALVGVAVALKVDESGACRDPRIVLSGVGGTPVRARQAEAALDGNVPSAELLAEIERAVHQEVTPPSDVHATADYRKRVAGVIARRAVARAAGSDNR